MYGKYSDNIEWVCNDLHVELNQPSNMYGGVSFKFKNCVNPLNCMVVWTTITSKDSCPILISMHYLHAGRTIQINL